MHIIVRLKKVKIEFAADNLEDIIQTLSTGNNVVSSAHFSKLSIMSC